VGNDSIEIGIRKVRFEPRFDSANEAFKAAEGVGFVAFLKATPRSTVAADLCPVECRSEEIERFIVRLQGDWKRMPILAAMRE
jgi:hypothetical protein